jgi:epoxyqueuosine reductase QueG
MNDMETDEIIAFLKENDIEIFGFTTVNNVIPSIPEDFSPQKMLKEAQSIICYAIPIPKGIIYSASHEKLLFWRYSSIAYRNLDNIANTLSILLEKQGHISTPINSCFPWKIVNREFWGLLSLVYWSEKAAIGKITKCGLLINPRYGTRILLGGVLTSKPIKQSEEIEQEICPYDCFKCIEACPAKAISQEGKVNHDLCMRTANQNPILAHIIKDKDLRKEIDFETIINTIGVEDHASYSCIECLKACPLNRL